MLIDGRIAGPPVQPSDIFSIPATLPGMAVQLAVASGNVPRELEKQHTFSNLPFPASPVRVTQLSFVKLAVRIARHLVNEINGPWAFVTR